MFIFSFIFPVAYALVYTVKTELGLTISFTFKFKATLLSVKDSLLMSCVCMFPKLLYRFR